MAKKGDISASELSSILQEKIEGMATGVKIDEVRGARSVLRLRALVSESSSCSRRGLN